MLCLYFQRFVKLPDDIETTTKDDLLELYYRYIIPRPQRTYRLNRRGREMTKKQVLRNKKRKITAPDSSEPPVKYVNSHGNVCAIYLMSVAYQKCVLRFDKQGCFNCKHGYILQITVVTKKTCHCG